VSSAEQTGTVPIGTEAVEEEITRFVEAKVKATPTVNQDLISTGLVTSMFAIQLVLFLEKTFSVEIVGRDLQLNNFRTVGAMAGLVRRLRGEAGGEAGA
jgi:methoxymalonate biosynthesis acyl carrier protein